LNLGNLDFDIVSPAPLDSETLSNWGNLELRISYFSYRDTNFPSTFVVNALQISTFLKNKPNFQKDQMNVSRVSTKDYEKRTLGQRGKNKANSNPIQTQSNPIKANKMPKQTQYKPNSNPIKPNFKGGIIIRKCLINKQIYGC